jgi:lysophospholipase
MSDVLFDTPGNPIPPNHFAGFFESFDGMRLRYAVFRSGSQVPRGTIVLLPGRNEPIEKYFETARDLNAQGLWVATMDWRGQGGSPRLIKGKQGRRRGHARRMRDFERDLDIFLEQVVLPDAKLPFFILAHSMGALIALKAAPRLSNRIERMALVAPFVGATGLGIPNWLLKIMANVSTLFGFGWIQFSRDTLANRPFEGNPLTSDRTRFSRNQAIIQTQPTLGIGPPTARWIATMIDTIEEVNTMDHLRKIEVPCLVIAPANDQIVPYVELEALSRKFRAGKLLTIPGAHHEILQERDIFREQALAAIAAFIPGSDADPEQYTSA